MREDIAAAGKRDAGSRTRWLASLLRKRSLDAQRLEAAISGFEKEIEWREEEGVPGPWVKAAKEFLSLAQRAAEEGLRDQAWRHVQSAMRLAVFGYNPAELENVRIALRQEAETKLGSWRRLAVVQLLSRQEPVEELVRSITDPAAAREITDVLRDRPDDARERITSLLRASRRDHAPGLAALLLYATSEEMGRGVESRERLALFNALQIRDEHFANVYRSVALSKRQLVVLSAVLAATLFGALVMAAWRPLALAEAPDGGRAWVWVFLFGTLGGCMTALLSVSRAPSGSRIPEQLAQWRVTAARPLIGGAAALLAYALFAAGVIRVGTGETAGALLALAFVAGFSERLVVGAVESVAGGQRRGGSDS